MGGECPHRDEVALYALDLMGPQQRLDFTQHSTGCPACRLQAQELAAVAELLAYAAPPARPDPALRQRVLQVAAPRPRAGRPLSPPAWAAAALVALTLAVGGLGWQVANLSAHQAAMDASHAQLDRLYRQADQRLQAAQRLAAQTAAGSQVLALAGVGPAPGASAEVLVVPERDGMHLLLRADGLPALRGSQAYQLWLIKDGRRTSGGTFVVDRTGRGGLAAFLPAQAFDALGVTLEPDDQGASPRGTKVLGT